MSYMREKISGILNNCALNTALPVMLKDFEILAKLETENQLPKLEYLGLDGIEQKSEIHSCDDCYISYHKLKEIFAITYEIDELTFTWQKLVNFLRSFKSFLAIQIIFLPVSRKFISEIAKNKNYDLYFLSSIQKGHEIKHEDNCTGKYNPLCGKEAWELFHSQFGIPVTITINEKETEEYNNCIIPPWGFENRKVNLFYNNKHFEICKNPDDISDEINYLEKKHDELYNIFLNLSNTNSDQNTNIYLKELQKYVHKKLKNNHNEVATTDSMIFNNMHFKLLILSIMIIALLLIIALILGSSGADKLIPTFLNDLAPKVYNTILGTSIAAESVSITFFTSLLINKENNDPSNIQKNGMHLG